MKGGDSNLPPSLEQWSLGFSFALNASTGVRAKCCLRKPMAALQQMFTIGRLKPGEGLGEFRPMLVSSRQISRFELHKRLFTEIAPLLCFFFF